MSKAGAISSEAPLDHMHCLHDCLADHAAVLVDICICNGELWLLRTAVTDMWSSMSFFFQLHWDLQVVIFDVLDFADR